ncbi:hypothetical protein G647_05847 [Cladophialophora carrionii CBS 160.54]|uniref:Uncharacterized protein n=1 Tax=Cladophialophora carrionii CBS 160.54 TaxID=1279043 RepID=V9D648_9EURO|nr:uncharacterized protein G647_05847 [Cladophialophora carrionii CBS 160.54]ETI21778.1 hypothetical protein G647_05847 [Cladophialophora carrionii CBS 160.54]
MAGSKGFLFVDAYPSATDPRSRELQRAQVLSHAARASHPKNRKDPPKRTANHVSAARKRESEQPVSEREGIETHRNDRSTSDEEGPSHEQNCNCPKRYSGVHRWRLIQRHSRSRVGGRNCQGAKSAKHPYNLAAERSDRTLPLYKGNSDPFNATAVPFSAFDLALVKDDRVSVIDVCWPAEISMRGNRAILVAETWKSMPSILDAPAVAHAIISHSHYSRAVRYQIQGRRDQNAMVLAEKHKMLAVRGLRDLLENYRQNGRSDLLVEIRKASAQLSACGIISGDVASAQVHFVGVKMVVDMMGGLKSMLPFQSEALLFSQVACAWFNRQRPVFHPDEWNPPSWPEFSRSLPKPLSSTVDHGIHPTPDGCTADTFQPSAMSPKVSSVVKELRDLLHLEEVKIALAATKSDMAEPVFRWSVLRKLAIRARNLILWCDLRDIISESAAENGGLDEIRASNSSTAFNMILCLTVRCFDRAILEEFYYTEQPSFRFSTMFLAEVEANLKRLDPPFPSGRTSDDKHLDFQGQVLQDERRFDMLWIYSVGAYIEHCNIKPSSRRVSTASAEPLVSSLATPGVGEQNTTGGGDGPFTALFSRLVKPLGFGTFQDLTSFLSERYLYCARVQDDSLRKLMEF